MSITIRTTQYEKNEPSTLYSDYLVKRQVDGKLHVIVVKYTHKYDNSKNITNDDIEIVKLDDYDHYNMFISEILGKIKSYSSTYSYIELEAQCFKNRVRHSREWKIDLSNQKRFKQFVNIEVFLDEFFDPQKKIQKERRLQLEVNDQEILDVDVNNGIDKLKQIGQRGLEMVKDGGDEVKNLIMDEAKSEINDFIQEKMSQYSSGSGRKKKKGLLRKLLGA